MPRRRPHVLLIPFPAKGHMLPMLDFAAVLADRRDLDITVVVTTGNAPLLAALLSRNPAVELLSLPFPSAEPSAALPAGVEMASDGAVFLLPAILHTFSNLRRPLAGWIQSSSPSVTAIIADFFCGWAHPLAGDLGIRSLVFSPSGAFGVALVHAAFRLAPPKTDSTISFPSLPTSPEFHWRQLSALYRMTADRAGEAVFESVKKNFAWNLQGSGFVSNTFRALEPAYLASPLEDLGFKKVYPVGPLLPAGRGTAVPAVELASRLDSFPGGSVIYICFGSMETLPLAHATALAGALEELGAPFVWAMPAGAELPEGFEEAAAAEERGIVFRGWAPQVEILNHPAVGWFLTHCGWNSVLEAAAAGVAMMTWPVRADQFYNERLLVEEAKIALPAFSGGAPEKGRLVAAMREAMAGEEGRAVKERAKEMGRAAAAAAGDGDGSSSVAVGELVKELQAMADDHYQ